MQLKATTVKTYEHHGINGQTKSRLYLWPDEFPTYQNYGKNWVRPVMALRAMLPAALEAAGLPSKTKASWSQRAGCPCGCSPAFMLEVWTGLDYHVDITVEDDDEGDGGERFLVTEEAYNPHEWEGGE